MVSPGGQRAPRIGRTQHVSAPYGFSTRVAAQSLELVRESGSLLERFCFRAVAVACALALGSVALNYRTTDSLDSTAVAALDEEALPLDDAISVVLDFAD